MSAKFCWSLAGIVYTLSICFPTWADEKADVTLQAACQKKGGELAKQLGETCRVLVRPPFVLAGTLTDEELEAWHKQTIQPAAEALAACYFTSAPSEPITVLLFPVEKDYNHFAKQLYGDAGVSVYGYYKPGKRTLIMNIGTGGGTLVHELTHALADFDYPRIPDWFNEGLASLHEQCRFRRDDSGPWIEGLENWRLPLLQESIRKKSLRSLQSLIADDDFRGAGVGLNYAQARYFCMYLQREKKLQTLYLAMRTQQKTDKLGLASVKSLFPGKSWDEIDQAFQAWAVTLKR